MNQRIPRGGQRAPGDTAPSDAALGIGIAKSEAAQAEADEGEQVDVEPEVAEQDQSPAASRATTPAAPTDEVEEIEPQLTRRSRTLGGDNSFDVPEKFKKPGWDYEFKTIRIIGADVDGYELASYHQQGWRAAKPSDMPGMMPPGSTEKTIDRLGQRLFMRPMYLTDQARAEDYQIAERQRSDKLLSAAGDVEAMNYASKIKHHVDTIQMDIVTGAKPNKAA